jgi:hypothetical protein
MEAYPKPQKKLLLGLVRGELCVLLVCWCCHAVMLARVGSEVFECVVRGACSGVRWLICSWVWCVLWGAVVDLLLSWVRALGCGG